MLRRAGYPLIFAAMFAIAGGHWAVLQGVAWTGMIIEYSKNSTLGEALTKTFSGEAPCRMCKTIEAGQQKESRLPATVKADKKFEGLVFRRTPLAPIPPNSTFSYPPISDETACARPGSPPAPVPITA